MCVCVCAVWYDSSLHKMKQLISQNTQTDFDEIQYCGTANLSNVFRVDPYRTNVVCVCMLCVCVCVCVE